MRWTIQRRAAPVRQGRLSLHLGRRRGQPRRDRTEPRSAQRQAATYRSAWGDPGRLLIPPDNPFASSGFARHEIWASGLRNPWRFSFDAGTGDLTIGDVGAGSWEEIDLAPAPAVGRGANFGWPACEGFAGSCPGATPPVFAYPHNDPGGDVAHGCAIIGGYVYRGTQIPALAGRYLASISAPASSARSSSASRSREAIAPKAPGRSQCAVVVRPGRELQSLRHQRPQCGDKLVGPPSSATPACPANPSNLTKCKKKHKKKRHPAAAKKHKKRKKKCQKKKHKKKKKRS